MTMWRSCDLQWMMYWLAEICMAKNHACFSCAALSLQPTPTEKKDSKTALKPTPNVDEWRMWMVEWDKMLRRREIVCDAVVRQGSRCHPPASLQICRYCVFSQTRRQGGKKARPCQFRTKMTWQSCRRPGLIDCLRLTQALGTLWSRL